jgi:hypothetical protein
MTSAEELRELEQQLSSLKNKKAQLDTEAMRHEMELNSAKKSLESSLKELQELGFNDLKSAEDFVDKAIEQLIDLINKAKSKVESIEV